MTYCCASLAKYLLCLANFVFFVVGGLVLTVGVWVAADKASFVQMTQLDAVLSSELGSQAQSLLAEYSQPGVLEQAAYLLIAVGSLIFVIAFLGYCGALQESRVLLTAYALFITLMFGLQIADFSLFLNSHIFGPDLPATPVWQSQERDSRLPTLFRTPRP